MKSPSPNLKRDPKEPGDTEHSAGTGSRQSAEFVPRIHTEIAGVHFQNPVLTASGTFGYGQEFAQLIDLNCLGGIVVKGGPVVR